MKFIYIPNLIIILAAILSSVIYASANNDIINGNDPYLPRMSLTDYDYEEQGENKDAQKKSVRFRRTRLFEPLIADQRWPHFSIAYHYYIDDEELKNVGATSFGESLLLYTGKAPFYGHVHMGIQAAVFAIFDLDAESNDLINADYWVGSPISYQRDDFSLLFRIFHQSSHLGDEFLLRSRMDRVNLSYESIDLKLSYDISKWFRIYGGSGYFIRKEPDDLKPWSTQAGFEFKSTRTYLGEMMRPVAGIDFTTKEENSWRTDATVRAGIEVPIEKDNNLDYRMQFMLEYFNGYSPNGQFYERQIEYISLGSHFYF